MISTLYELLNWLWHNCETSMIAPHWCCLSLLRNKSYNKSCCYGFSFSCSCLSFYIKDTRKFPIIRQGQYSSDNFINRVTSERWSWKLGMRAWWVWVVFQIHQEIMDFHRFLEMERSQIYSLDNEARFGKDHTYPLPSWAPLTNYKMAYNGWPSPLQVPVSFPLVPLIR